MDIDPLQDTLPPRYAIESDEEEDEINPLQLDPIPKPVVIDVKLLGEVSKNKPLILAIGEAGAFWAKGADLGEQTAAVSVNGIQVGLLFNPNWTQANIIISEGLTRLPLSFMHHYAQSVLDELNPSRVSLLDSYAIPSYSSDRPISIYEAPIRYLSTSVQVSLAVELFQPPNLLQSTSASFLSILTIQDHVGTLVLLPSAHIPQPPPKTLFPSNFMLLTKDDILWSSSTMNEAQRLILQAIQGDTCHTWEVKSPQTHQNIAKSKRTEIGEGAMYI